MRVTDSVTADVPVTETVLVSDGVSDDVSVDDGESVADRLCVLENVLVTEKVGESDADRGAEPASKFVGEGDSDALNVAVTE